MKDLPEFTQLDHEESRKLAFEKFVRRQKVGASFYLDNGLMTIVGKATRGCIVRRRIRHFPPSS